MSATLSIRIYANDVDKATVGVVEWEAKAVSCSARPEQWSLSKWSLSPNYTQYCHCQPDTYSVFALKIK